MNNWSDKIALLTDAAFTTGPQIAELLVENGVTVVGTAHKLNRLYNLAEKLSNKRGKFIPYEFDLFDGKKMKIGDLFDWIRKNVGPVQLIIGHVGHCGDFFMSEARAEYQYKILNLTIVLKKAAEELQNCNLVSCIIPVCIVSPFYNSNLSAAYLKYVAFVNSLKSEFSQKNCTVSIVGEHSEEEPASPSKPHDAAAIRRKHIEAQKNALSEMMKILFFNV